MIFKSDTKSDSKPTPPASPEQPRPKLPIVPEGPAAYAPVGNHRRQLSAQYAAAQEAWGELERELDHVKTLLGAANNHNQILDEANKLLHEEIENLKERNERLVRENTTIHTRLADAASVLLNITKPITKLDMDRAEVRLEETQQEAIRKAVEDQP